MQTHDDPARPSGETRRDFLKKSAAAAAFVSAGAPLLAGCATAEPVASSASASSTAALPWYRRACRWGQTNITELDPTHYDIPWWRDYWKKTCAQGVIINAGGIIAYYPSKFPLHRQAEFLKGRDLYGELATAAHDDGLAVLARMDSSRAHEDFYRAHQDWFVVEANGRPNRVGELYTACINSPYVTEYLPGILREIIERTRPQGITDNSWSGLGRNTICFCKYCAEKFHAATSHDLPRNRNWTDPVYRQWIQWNYARRLEIWDANNRLTREAGGPDCLWLGMNSGWITASAQDFRDYKEICARTPILMLDHQARVNSDGFQHNGLFGKLVHGLLGWDKLIPESMAMYQAAGPLFRFTSVPAAEARLWMLDGFAGGIQPWWHHLGAYQEDRRMFRTAPPVMQWHKANEPFLVNREPIATVGMVWSQQNTDFYGRENPDNLVDLPLRGVVNAMVRSRIPALPVHIDHVERDLEEFSVLVLPNVAAMSDAQVAAVRKFVARGGGLVATGESSLCDEWGEPRADFALADLFGAHFTANPRANQNARHQSYTRTEHSYLRLFPEMRASVDGPKSADEPRVTTQRHPVLRGFEETDLLPFGGYLDPLKIDEHAQVLLTYVPTLPNSPPEKVWSLDMHTNLPGLILNQPPGGGRVAFLPADLDRRYGRDNMPDYATLLANLVRWAANDDIPLAVEGPGLFDCHLYRQRDHLILHVVNLSNPGAARAWIDEFVPTGPIRVKIRLPKGMSPGKSRFLVSGGSPSVSVHDGWAAFEIKSILDHEVVVI